MRFFLCTLLFVAALGDAARAQAGAASPPNIIFILADDSAFADFGCYGHPYARTPNLDQLAKDGTRFQQFYATGVTCCPARTGLMTSKWPASYHVYPANGGFAGQVTITELLKKAGYATGHFGKWHLGPVDAPGTYGIDARDPEDAHSRRDSANPRGRDAPIYDAAIKFVEAHKDGPFYMNVWSHISHYPVNPPQSYIDKFKDVVIDESKFAAPMQETFDACRKRGGDVNEHMRAYLAEIFSMDEDIGRLLRRVDELGLRDHTIVVFSSDQGPPSIRPDAQDDARRQEKKSGRPASQERQDERLNAMGYTGGLRGGKSKMYEGGVRVPFLVRWPGHVPAGRVDEKSVIGGADWLPTLCAITGTPIEADKFDGEDSSDAWLGGEHVRKKALFWKTSAVGSEAGIRDGQWKLIMPTRKRGEVELYDIPADPGENHNLAMEHADVVKTLGAKLQAWVATLPKDYIKTGDKDN
jgi:N-acetylgalactosamine-6-sulfatase